MSKWAWVGGGVLLALVVGLSFRLGAVRRDVKNQAAIMVQVTAQRDAARKNAVEAEQLATDRGLIKDSLLAKLAEVEAANAAEREAMGNELAASRARYRILAASKPANLPECMKGLEASNKHVSLLDKELRMTVAERDALRLALDASQAQIAELETSLRWYKEAVNLDDVRLDAVEDWRRARRKKLIWGLTLGFVVVGGLGVGVGYAVAR